MVLEGNLTIDKDSKLSAFHFERDDDSKSNTGDIGLECSWESWKLSTWTLTDQIWLLFLQENYLGSEKSQYFSRTFGSIRHKEEFRSTCCCQIETQKKTILCSWSVCSQLLIRSSRFYRLVRTLISIVIINFWKKIRIFSINNLNYFNLPKSFQKWKFWRKKNKKLDFGKAFDVFRPTFVLLEVDKNGEKLMKKYGPGGSQNGFSPSDEQLLRLSTTQKNSWKKSVDEVISKNW